MTKQEFLERLNQLLCDIPKTEREEAIFYYEEYFDEANIGDMENVLEKIDSPEKIAASIRGGLQENENSGEFTERGYYEEGMKVENELMRNGELSKDRATQENNTDEGYFKKKFKKNNEKILLDKSKIILICVVLILTIPVWGGFAAALLGIILGILGTVLGVAAGILGAILGVVVGIISATFGFLTKGISYVVMGVIEMLEFPTLGITSIGIGLVCFGTGMLCLMLMVWILSTMLPTCIRGIKWIFKRLSGKPE